jgi:hypothetical protein
MRVWKNHYGPRGGYKGGGYYDSIANKQLHTREWILNKADELMSAGNVTLQSLSDQYDTTSAEAEALIRFLRLHDDTDDNSHLSEEECRKIKLADEIEQSGLSEDEIRTAIADAKRKKSTPSQTDQDGSINKQAVSSLIRDIESRRPSVKESSSTNQSENPPVPPSNESEDADDYTPQAVDFGKKLDRAKDRYANELDRIEHEQKLHGKQREKRRWQDYFHQFRQD